MKSLKGCLLVASPYMGDPNFSRTVVLLIHHGAEGAYGVVLNRPLPATIKQLWEKLSTNPCDIDRFVNFGGPVSGPLIALHNEKALGEARVRPGVYLAAERDHLEQLIRQTKQPLRVFVGHAGWGKGQLEVELARGDWLTTPAKMEHIFAEDENLWTTTLRQIGRSFISSVLKLKHVPQDPSWN